MKGQWSFYFNDEYLRPGGSVGVGVVGGSVGTASAGIKSHTAVCKNANSSTAIKLWSFLPFSATIATCKFAYFFKGLCFHLKIWWKHD